MSRKDVLVDLWAFAITSALLWTIFAWSLPRMPFAVAAPVMLNAILTTIGVVLNAWALHTGRCEGRGSRPS